MSEEKRTVLLERGREIVQNAESYFIDLDVEADAIPGHGSLLSIGAVTPNGETFYRELRPAHEYYDLQTHRFCESHGLKRERLSKEGLPIGDALNELNDWAITQSGERSPVLAAFNAGYDSGWIDYEMNAAGIKNPFGIAGYCLKSLAMSLQFMNSTEDAGMCTYNWRSTTKTNLPKLLVPPREFTHNALEDAQWQQELHFAMVGFLALKGSGEFKL